MSSLGKSEVEGFGEVDWKMVNLVINRVNIKIKLKK